MLERDSRLWALGFEHRLHRQVSSLRVFGEVLLWPELVLQSLGEVPHLFPRGCLRRDLGGDVREEGGGGDEGRRSGWEKRQITKNFPKIILFPIITRYSNDSTQPHFNLEWLPIFFHCLVIHFLLLSLFRRFLLPNALYRRRATRAPARLTFSGKLSRANIKYCPAGNKKSSLW